MFTSYKATLSASIKSNLAILFPQADKVEVSENNDLYAESSPLVVTLNKKKRTLKYLNADAGAEYAVTLGDLSVIYTMKSGTSAVNGYARLRYVDFLSEIVSKLPQVGGAQD